MHLLLLRGQESGFTSCCSSLWPPEGRVQVSHSGAPVSSAQVCRGAESRTRLDAEVLAQRGIHGDAEKPHFAAKLSCGQSVHCWSLWMCGLKLRPVLGFHLCLCVAARAQGSPSDEDCFLIAAPAPTALALGFPEGAWWSGLCPGNILP